MNLSSNLLPAQVDAVVRQMHKYINENLVSAWAIRSSNGTYLYGSAAYVALMTNEVPLLSNGLDSLNIDNATIADIRYKDKITLEQNKILISPEPFMLNGRLVIAEVRRYPLLEQTRPIAIGVVLIPLYSLNLILDKYKACAFIHEPRMLNNLPFFKLRDKLIGIMVLFGLTVKQIATLLGVSMVRVSGILGRICRSKFGISGGGQCYRQQLINMGIYKQFLWELSDSEYTTLLLEAYQLSLAKQ